MTSYIIGAVRTPRSKGKVGKGALTGVHPQELLPIVLRELPALAGFEVADVDDLVTGAVSQVSEQGANISRNAVLAAEWPREVGGVSLNRFCGSGLQAVNFAAMGIASGAQQLVVAGGVESMSMLGLGADGGGQDGRNVKLRGGIARNDQVALKHRRTTDALQQHCRESNPTDLRPRQPPSLG